MKIGFIGIGNLGSALSRALDKAGFSIVALYDIEPAKAEAIAHKIKGSQTVRTEQEVADLAETVFITTTDDRIAEVEKRITWRSDHQLVHCSGMLSRNILTNAISAGAKVASLHPMQSFVAAAAQEDIFKGIYFSVESDQEQYKEYEQMVKRLGANCFPIAPEDKLAYHFSCAIASNFSAVIMNYAVKSLSQSGLSKEQALEALLPLLKGTVKNLESIGLPAALTGPIARGDLQTVSDHIELTSSMESQERNLHLLLMQGAVKMAVENETISSEKADAIIELLSRAKALYNE